MVVELSCDQAMVNDNPANRTVKSCFVIVGFIISVLALNQCYGEIVGMPKDHVFEETDCAHAELWEENRDDN